jgi:hypothetical protein
LLDPNTVESLTQVIEEVGRILGLGEHNEAFKEAIARKIVELSGSAGCDPIELRARELRAVTK